MSLPQIQFLVLLGGTVFAWFNVYLEFKNWLKGKKGRTACPANVKNPVLTPCFWGAVFFTIALALNPYFLDFFN